MTDTDAVGTLRGRIRDLARQVDRVDGAPTPPLSGAGGPALYPTVRGGMTEQLLAALVAHHQALDAFERAVGPLRDRGVPAGEVGAAIDEALDGVYQASDVAHETVRRAVDAVHDAARLQSDAVGLADLAARTVSGVPGAGSSPTGVRPPGG